MLRINHLILLIGIISAPEIFCMARTRQEKAQKQENQEILTSNANSFESLLRNAASQVASPTRQSHINRWAKDNPPLPANTENTSPQKKKLFLQKSRQAASAKKAEREAKKKAISERVEEEVRRKNYGITDDLNAQKIREVIWPIVSAAWDREQKLKSPLKSKLLPSEQASTTVQDSSRSTKAPASASTEQPRCQVRRNLESSFLPTKLSAPISASSITATSASASPAATLLALTSPAATLPALTSLQAATLLSFNKSSSNSASFSKSSSNSASFNKSSSNSASFSKSSSNLSSFRVHPATLPASASPAATLPASASPAATLPASASPAATLPASASPAATLPASASPAATLPASASPAATRPAV